jgi:hypothetical protein
MVTERTILEGGWPCGVRLDSLRPGASPGRQPQPVRRPGPRHPLLHRKRCTDAPIEPMDLADMRENDVRSLAVSCWNCQHEAVLNAERWPDDVPVPSFGPRMVCTGVELSARMLGRTGRSDRSARP